MADEDRKFIDRSSEVLVSTDAAAKILAENRPGVRILDASWHLPFTKRKAREEYYRAHIPGALFFDIDECCDKNSEQEHMMPSPEVFAEYVGNKMGINNDSHVILYDNNENFGIVTAPRVWWMFRTFGHDKVSIINGGFPKWMAEDREYTDEIIKFEPQEFKPNFRPEMITSFEEVVKNVDKGENSEIELMDARPAGRFGGTAPEPRPDIKPGHVPRAHNVPFSKLCHEKDKVFKSVGCLRFYFDKIDKSKKIVAMCGSGISGCNILLAAYIQGIDNTSLYDGSWSEYYKRAKFNQMVLKKP